MIRPKRYLMKLAERELQFGDRTLIMGIINVTPDSFSDGGDNMDPDRAAARALELEEEGADIIDIGAESTRPGSERISEAEELRRLIPVLKKLRGKLSVPISVDTTKAAVAAKALETGAELINDASTLTFDAELAKVVAEANAGLILNHMRGTPETWAKLGSMAYPMKSVMEDLEAGISRARRAGVDRARIIVDPGLGFGKRGEQNYELIARLGEMAAFDSPILVGPSRKSFLGQQETIDADRATAAAVTAAVLQGAHIVRVHNVAAIRAVLQTADGILRTAAEETAAKKPKKAVAPRDVEFGDKRAPAPMEGKPLRPPGPPKPEVKPFDERPPRRFDDDRPPRPPFRDRDDDRPPRPPLRDRGDDGPPKRFSRADSGDRPSRPPFRDRGDDGPPKRLPRPDSGDRPPRAPYRDRGDDGPPKRFSRSDSGDRPSRPPFRGRSDDGPPKRFPRAGGDDRPPFRDRGDGPPKRFSRSDSGDRPPRPPFRDKPEGDRPPFKKPYGAKNAGDRPPFRKASGDGGDRPPFKKSFGGSKPPFKKDSGDFKPKRSPVRSPRPKRDK